MGVSGRGTVPGQGRRAVAGSAHASHQAATQRQGHLGDGGVLQVLAAGEAVETLRSEGGGGPALLHQGFVHLRPRPGQAFQEHVEAIISDHWEEETRDAVWASFPGSRRRDDHTVTLAFAPIQRQ